ncbi:hypothetical protein IV37_GL001452 [Fructilactobacillus fructivorans]|uniref:Gfo/Idh/MocA family oxidoreductase n=1 Tax=Fructilactobacillus fructivorans TaxID=1614 RepID=UPI0007150BBD|nr:Gfo/Idh/MocA family oxidoreductase [Fructilactobacillus fructivorans]KRN12223.1 hypothetical protein IV37_GL001452 [Fructilactobacillus fructivorans]
MINLGVIGTNWITQKFIDAAASTGKYKLNAVYSRKLDTARQFAQPNDCDNLFDDLQVFLNQINLIRFILLHQMPFIISR